MPARGFSLIETVVALALTLALSLVTFAMLQPSAGAFAAEPETADVHQRQRVAIDALTRDLSAAGAGISIGVTRGPLIDSFASLLPYRLGITSRDPVGTVRTDVVTSLSIPATAAQTTLAADLLQGVLTVQATAESGCAPGIRLCGFAGGTSVAIFDDAGNVGVFAIAAVNDAAGEITLTSWPPGSPARFRAGSTLAQVRIDIYSLKSDAVSQTFQLLHGDGTASGDSPVADHVVALAFDYDGDPQPPAIAGAATTYGPAPPPAGTQTSGFPDGENCVFERDSLTGAPVPRLAPLAGDTALVPLAAAQFADGPWCPDSASANRWDADLLRIRRVNVTVRVEAASSMVRGPAGPWFTNGGSSTGANRWVRDREIRFRIAPRNLNLRWP